MTATYTPAEQVAGPVRLAGSRAGDAASDAALADRLVEAGHEPVRRSDTGLVVGLGNRGRQHAMARCDEDRIRVEVSIAAGKPLSESARLALARYLALGASAFHGLTWTVQDEGGRQSARLTIALAHDADASAIHEAIEGLALACDQLGPAARALADEAVARRYLTHLTTPNQGAA